MVLSRVEAQAHLELGTRTKIRRFDQARISANRSASWPIGRSKIHTPKMRGGRKKLYANALPLLGEVADKYHAAFLLLFGDGVDQDNVRAQFHFRLHVKQSAVSIDDDGLAILAEFPAYSGLARSTDRYASKDAGTSTSRRTGRCGVHEPIVRPTAVRVNSTFPIWCPKCSRSESAAGNADDAVWRGTFRSSSISPIRLLSSDPEIWKRHKTVPLAVVRRTSVEWRFAFWG